MKQVRTILFRKSLASVALAVIGAAVLASGCSAPVQPAAISAGGSLANTITVTGTGDSTGAPDVANIQLGIDISDPQVGAAIQKANDVMNAVTAAVKGKGVDDKDLQTTNFNIYPEDVTDKTTGQPTGQRIYHVQNFLNVKLHDTSKIGDVIDAGLSAGATNVSGLSFSVEDTSKLEADARAKALKDAQDRAQQLASAIGVKLGKPVLVSETLGGGVITPFNASSAAGGFGGGGAPPISAGEQTVTIMVNVTYAISQ